MLSPRGFFRDPLSGTLTIYTTKIISKKQSKNECANHVIKQNLIQNLSRLRRAGSVNKASSSNRKMSETGAGGNNQHSIVNCLSCLLPINK